MKTHGNHLHRLCWMLTLLGVLGVTGSATIAQADGQSEFQALYDGHGEALVTVKFLLKVKMGGSMSGYGDQESDTEINGVMISPDGLVLCSNTQLAGFASMFRRLMGPRGNDITATPSDVKVLVGDDTEGVDAEVLGRDSDLDLTWVQIKDVGDRKYKFLDFSSSVQGQIGQRLLVMTRMGKYFDRTLIVGEGRISGITTKPRRLYVPGGDLGGQPGQPIFALDGKLVGMTAVQMPSDEDADMGGGPFDFGAAAELESMTSGLILPADVIVKATQRAKAAWEEQEE